MPVIISFGRPAFAGSVGVLALGKCRISETISLGGSTSASAQDGEIAYVQNTEEAAIYMSHGTTPDATATSETQATSARYGFPSGGLGVIVVKPGDKISVEAIA